MFQDLSRIERKRTFWVLGIMITSIVVLVLDSQLGPSVISAVVWGYAFSAAYLILAFALNDELLKKIFLFSLLAGFAELPADHYLVYYTDTLVYPSHEPMIWSSPLYMPFSWSVVLVEFGYISWLLLRRFNALKSGIMVAVLGACLVPLYEHWAISAGWWDYHHTLALGPVPYYIIVAEGLLMLPIPFFVSRINNGTLQKVGIYALLEGLVMFVACMIAIAIF